MRTTEILTVLNLLAVAVSVPASLFMAVIPFPLVIVATVIMIPVAVLNLAGIVVSGYAAFRCDQLKKARVLFWLSLTPGIVYAICFAIGKHEWR